MLRSTEISAAAGTGDWISKPLSLVQAMFAQNETSRDWEKKVTDYFHEKLQNNLCSWVPSLNDSPLHYLKPGGLVRFRCMVQDMFDPEFYMGIYETVHLDSSARALHLGKYRDMADCTPHQEVDFHSSRTVTLERQTFYCVPVPGESPWVKEVYSSSLQTRACASTSNAPNRLKRSLEEDDELPPSPGMQNTGDVQEKCKRLEMENQEKQQEAGASRSSQSLDLYFPLPGETGPACLVKVYENWESFKVNDVLEVYGILSVEPALSALNEDRDSVTSILDPADCMDTLEEQRAHSPPTSLVPRIHAIVIQKLLHTNPLIPNSVCETEESKQSVSSFVSQLSSVRAELLGFLTHALLGDSLAAEYLILHLISTVLWSQPKMFLVRENGRSPSPVTGSRALASDTSITSTSSRCTETCPQSPPIRDGSAQNAGVKVALDTSVLTRGVLALTSLTLPLYYAESGYHCEPVTAMDNRYARRDVLPLGKFSLNLSGCPRNSGFSQYLYRALQQIVTVSHYLPMTIENMNTTRFIPCKDYSANRLVSGLLQLPSHTLLVVDETVLEQGQLDTAGVRNLTALGNLITWQKVDYDFSYHQMEFPCNINVLVTSEGRSLLPSDCQVHLKPQLCPPSLEQYTEALMSATLPSLLNKFRMYLSLLQNMDYTISEEVTKAVEDDFVDMRKGDPQSISADDLHRLLVVARLLSLGTGQTSLSCETWLRAKELEIQRKSRLQDQKYLNGNEL